MKYLIFFFPLLFIGLNTVANEHSASERRIGFFGFDVNSYFTPPDLKHDDFGLDLRYGGEIFPQNVFEVGIRLKNGSPDIILRYSYDFTTKGHNKWIPGINAGLLLGVKRDNDEKIHTDTDTLERYLATGVDINLFVERFISQRVAVLGRLGTVSEYIILSKPETFNLKNVSLYIGAGVKWYLN